MQNLKDEIAIVFHNDQWFVAHVSSDSVSDAITYGVTFNDIMHALKYAWDSNESLKTNSGVMVYKDLFIKDLEAKL